MIRSFKSKALKLYWTKGDASKLPPDQVRRIGEILLLLDEARNPGQMNMIGYRFHELKGNRRGTYSVSVTGNWRITFSFDGENAVLLDYEDYH